MKDLEEEIINRAYFYQKNPRTKDLATSTKFDALHEANHKDFQANLLPYIKKKNQKFIEYWPAYFLWGQESTHKSGFGNNKVYRHVSGTFGTGYLCLTEQTIFITFLAEMTKKFPMFTNDFIGRALSGLAGEIDDRKPYEKTNTWEIPFNSVVGAQITVIEKREVIYLRTTSIDWQIEGHFNNSSPLILAGINMGKAGKLARLWQDEPEVTNQTSPDAIELLKKLGELKAAGVISEAEFEQKKQEILKRI